MNREKSGEHEIKKNYTENERIIEAINRVEVVEAFVLLLFSHLQGTFVCVCIFLCVVLAFLTSFKSMKYATHVPNNKANHLD